MIPKTGPLGEDAKVEVVPPWGRLVRSSAPRVFSVLGPRMAEPAGTNAWHPVMGRPKAYRYKGDMVCTPKIGSTVFGDLNGAIWISSDMSYRFSSISLPEFTAGFPDAYCTANLIKGGKKLTRIVY